MSKKKKKKPTSNGHDENLVKAKKHLGQHFLKDETIAQRIADTLSLQGYTNVIEIGPGMGVLTKYLLLRDMNLVAMDLDSESIVYLNHSFPLEHPKVLENNGYQKEGVFKDAVIKNGVICDEHRYFKLRG